MYLTCQLAGDRCCQSAVDSLCDSLAMATQPMNCGRTRTGLNSAAAFLTDPNRAA